MNSGSIVDTLYFGSFAKASSVKDSGKGFVYCPGPRATLKLIENEENLAEVSQALLDENLVTISIAKVAEAADLSVETVTSILAGVRDEIVDLVMVRKTNATLNFGFGLLQLRIGGTIEFKSGDASVAVANFPEFDRIPHSTEFDAETNAKNSVAAPS